MKIEHQYYIELLKQELESLFEQEVSIANSQLFSDLIFEKTNNYVSSSTIQRFFELVSNTSKTSKNTLNFLANYVGYSSWLDFQQKHKEERPISKSSLILPDRYGKILFDICLKNHDFKSVINYLEYLPAYFTDYDLLKNVGQSLGKVIRKDLKARSILLPELAKSKVGRFYFYENFVDIDYLNHYYKDAITKHYLKYLTPNSPKIYNADFIFATSIEFLALIKIAKYKEAIRCSYILFKEVDINTPSELFKHPYPYSRFIAIYLISEWLKKSLTINKIETSIFRIEKLMLSQESFSGTFVLAQLIMALNFCCAHKEVINLYDKYESLINTAEKSSDNYLPIINCVKNSYLNLGIKKGLELKALDFYSLENINTAQGSNILL